jgi:alpha-glucosidase
MNRDFAAALFLLLCAASPARAAADAAPGNECATLRSPDGRLQVAVLCAPAGAAGPLRYRVTFSGETVIDASELGVRLADGTESGRESVIVGSERATIDASFEQIPGKRRHVADRANELTLALRERGETPLQWRLVLRAYDDGIALRYRFDAQPGRAAIALADERTAFAFPAGSAATALPLGSFTTSHEGRYERSRVEDIPAGRLLALPLLVQLPGVGWAAVLEANLTDHAGLYLQRSGDRLVGRLSPRPGEPGVAVRAALPHDSPWRLILVGDDVRQLVDSDTVLKLNAPSVIRDASWIRPGKTTFPWWNGYHEPGVPFRMGLNTATARHYIDFCAEYGIPYHTLDGLGDTAWYGGPIVPYEGADITQGAEGLDLQEVLAYARQKGVRLRLWLHWQAAKQHMARAFPLYRAWGVEGVMIDFMDRNDQAMVNFQRELLQLAADNRLTVTFHGVAAPTGLERTYPHLLNSEAVLNWEHNKWDERGVPPEHDVTVPVTRMLAGPLDYHQGSLRGVPAGQFRARSAGPLVVGTPVRMLASYVVFQNHLPMMADSPSAYRGHPLTAVMADLPATWDETKTLVAEPGKEIVIARRHGNDWWIGAMTDGEPRVSRIPLSFMPAGTFRSITYRDEPAAKHGFAQTERRVSPGDELELELAAAGGAVVRLTPAPAPPPQWTLAWSDDSGARDPDAWQEVDGRLVSRHAQRLGRWEVRARLSGKGGRPSTIRLQPDAPWPAAGGIDIAHRRAGQPSITSSAFHWVDRAGERRSFAFEQQMAVGDELVSYDDGFHVFACEWVENQLRFYVDDVYHSMIYDDEAGYMLPKTTAPMRLVIDNAEVDRVRVFALEDAQGERDFRNGGFDENGGSAAGWHLFGNRIDGSPEVRVHRDAARNGTHALRLAGQGTGDGNYSGASQGISVAGGERVRARLSALVPSQERLTDPNDRAFMKIEFYNHWGEYFAGPAMLGVEERAIGDASTATDAWQEHTLEAVAPAGAVEARLTLVFGQAGNAPGAVYVDAVELARGSPHEP